MENKETFTILEAAEKWIAMIEGPSTKATPEQKSTLIARIRAAAQNARVHGVGYPNGAPETVKTNFTDATNEIKRAMKAEA